MRLAPPSLVINRLASKGQDRLLFQRLFWGALTGCLVTLLLAESPVLQSMDLTTLEWRYKTSDFLATAMSKPTRSSDISIVEFDDLSQFDLGIARFNDLRSQRILAEAVQAIEQGSPLIVVIDLDLRGATAPQLVALMKRYRNVVIALFGNLEGTTDLPGADFLTHAAAYGYDELSREEGGLICRLPISEKIAESSQLGPVDQFGASVPSLTEATIDLHRQLKGVGPTSEFFASRSDQPLFIGFNRIVYPSVSLRDTLDPSFQPLQFRDRIVLIGSTFTQRRNAQRHTPLSENVADVDVHADAINSLLADQVIYSFPKNIAHHILLLIGAIFGAAFSVSPLAMRTIVFFATVSSLIVIAQFAFQGLHQALPVVPPLAVLTVSFSLGTFIYLDTGLRLRNRELAQARESMQIRAEEERQRIAEDLHDETLPALSSVARMADKLSGELNGNPIPAEMREKLDLAVAEMRRVINDLHPSVLETMGFKPALENLLGILSQETHIEANFVDTDQKSDYSLPNFNKLQLYRIVQEALNNVQKHAQATRVELSIGEKMGYLLISIVDNGRGIDAKAVRKDSHGLLNIRQRAQLIGAQVDWRKPSQFTTGTEIIVRIPVLEEQTIG